MKKLSKLLITLLVFSSFFPLAASIRNLDSAQKVHIGVFEEISPNLHLYQNPYLTETQQGCNDFCQYDAHRPLYVWYFRARYFSDELGRFISRDPLGFVDGYGLYNGYFAQRFLVDPSGKYTSTGGYWGGYYTKMVNYRKGTAIVTTHEVLVDTHTTCCGSDTVVLSGSVDIKGKWWSTNVKKEVRINVDAGPKKCVTVNFYIVWKEKNREDTYDMEYYKNYTLDYTLRNLKTNIFLGAWYDSTKTTRSTRDATEEESCDTSKS